MKSELRAKNVKELEIQVESNAMIEISQSKDNSFFFIAHYNSPKLIFEQENHNNKQSVKITNKVNQKLINDFINNFANFKSFVDIFDFLSKDSLSSEKIKIFIELPDTLDEFDIKLNNGLLSFNYLSTANCNIKGNNIGLVMKNTILVNNCDIKINNANIEIFLSNKLNRMNVKINKGNALFIREKNGQNIGVVAKGNNIIKNGTFETNNNVVFCKINSGVINVR